MISLSLILLIVAFVLFVLAAIGTPAYPRFNWLAGGLAVWVLSNLLAGVRF